MVDGSLNRSLSSVTARLARNALLATFGVALSVAALPALALATTSSNQTTPETRPAIETTSVSATLEGWLGSAEQPERKEPREPEGRGEPKERPPRVDPERLPASWYFEYAPGASCTGTGYVTTPEHVAMLNGFDEARVAVTGLQPSTEYTACLVNWHTVLPGVSFTTLTEVSAPPGTEPPRTMGSSDNPLVSPLPVSTTGGTFRPNLTNKALLGKALKLCDKKPKKQRPSCKRQSERKYAAAARNKPEK